MQIWWYVATKALDLQSFLVWKLLLLLLYKHLLSVYKQKKNSNLIMTNVVFIEVLLCEAHC